MSEQATKKIGVVTATIIGMNAMIGSGIFSAPALLAHQVGPAGIFAYAVVIVSVFFIALSLARVAMLYPETGSFYTYTKVWAGHTGGLIAASAYCIGLIVAMGLLCHIAAIYLQLFFPSVSAYSLGLYALGALVILNMFGLVFSEIGQHILIACTVFPLIATTMLCLSKASMTNLVPFAPYGLVNAMKATRVVIFGFFGFECAASLFDVVENPRKNVPRALTYSIILVGMLYLLFVGSIIAAVPAALFTDPTVPLSEVLAVIFPEKRWIVTIIHLSIVSAVLGTIHSMILSASHLIKQLFGRIRNASVRNLVAHNVINLQLIVLLVGLCIATTYLTISSFDLFMYITAVAIIFACITSIITLLTLKKEWISGHNIVTVLALVTASAIFFFACEGIVQNCIV